MHTAAGEGDHMPYYIRGTDTVSLKRQSHYLGIDAVTWFVNKQSGWWKNYAASGTLEITLAGGQEKYEVPLGVYELTGGARVAPVFDRAVLPDRVYRGGPISFRATISGFKKDTQLTKLIKSSTSAAFGVVSGMVATATATGPYASLAAAGTALIGGVKEVLDNADSELRLFDKSGFESNLPQEMIKGRESFLFLHRGKPLDKKKLKIAHEDEAYLVRYEDELLEDGVWLLLRLRICNEYPLDRPWHETFRTWMVDLVGLVDDVKAGRISKEDGSKRLRPGTENQPTSDDGYRLLRSKILSDGVLTINEAAAYATTLASYRRLAFDAVADGKYVEFAAGIQALKSGVVAIMEPGLLENQRQAAAATRSEIGDEQSSVALARETDRTNVQPLPLSEFRRLLDRLITDRPTPTSGNEP